MNLNIFVPAMLRRAASGLTCHVGHRNSVSPIGGNGNNFFDGDPGVYMKLDGERVLVGYMDPDTKYSIGDAYTYYGKDDHYGRYPLAHWMLGNVPNPHDPNPDQNNDVSSNREVLGSALLLVLFDADFPEGGGGGGGGFKELFKIRSARSWEALFDWGHNFDILKKLKTVSSAEVLRLKKAGVTLEQLQAWAQSYSEIITKKVISSNVIAKWRLDYVNKLISLW